MKASEEEVKNHEARFLALVASLSGAVMQHLGKVMNPLTEKIERNLPAAKETIDMLRMLREKTRGNLTDREERTLNALLSSVQLNYLDEAKAEAEKPEEKPEEKPAEQKEEGAPVRPDVEQKSEQAPAEEGQSPEQKRRKRKKTKRSRDVPAEG